MGKAFASKYDAFNDKASTDISHEYGLTVRSAKAFFDWSTQETAEVVPEPQKAEEPKPEQTDSKPEAGEAQKQKETSVDYRKELRQVFTDDLEVEELEDELFEKLYNEAVLNKFPEPEDLLCEFEAFEHNNTDSEDRLENLRVFLDTRSQQHRHDRDKERYELIIKEAISKNVSSLKKEIKTLKEEIVQLKTKTLPPISRKCNDSESELRYVKNNVNRIGKENLELQNKNKVLGTKITESESELRYVKKIVNRIGNENLELQNRNKVLGAKIISLQNERAT